MKKANQLKLYYELFMLTVENPRIMPKGIAEYFKYSGRGKARSTLLKHMENMYEKHISVKPQLALKAYLSSQKTTYLCRREEDKGLYRLCKRIDNDPRITYSLCFSSSEFFLISRDSDLNVEEFDLTLVKKSKLFSPYYTIPSNYSMSFSRALTKLQEYPFYKKNIERIVYDDPPWDHLDWDIFHAAKTNIRDKFTVIGRKAQTTSVSVKKHFYEKILPYTIIANYFFPKGFATYAPLFLVAKTSFEVSLVQSLSLLPSTSYVFPLEKRLALILHYEDKDDVVNFLDTLEKMEETAIIDSYLLFCPILYTK